MNRDINFKPQCKVHQPSQKRSAAQSIEKEIALLRHHSQVIAKLLNKVPANPADFGTDNRHGDHSRSVHVAIPVSFAANSATTSSYKFSLYSNQCRAETGRNVIVKAIFKAGFFQSRR